MNWKFVHVNTTQFIKWVHEYCDLSTKSQGHPLTFVQGHLDIYFPTSSTAKPLGPPKPNFMPVYSKINFAP